MTPPDHSSDALLRSDIREMGRILGDVIREQWGNDFFGLVEEVRTATRALREQPDPERLETLLATLDRASLWEIVRLARSFTIYFHIANTAEQHHRISSEFAVPQHDTEAVIERAVEQGASIGDLQRFYDRAHIRPVLTAHPTEAARRSILSKLQTIDESLAEWEAGHIGGKQRLAARRRIAEMIEGIVQTDELRLLRPRPLDEARSIIFYLEQLFHGALSDVVGSFNDAMLAAGVTTYGHTSDDRHMGTPDLRHPILVLEALLRSQGFDVRPEISFESTDGTLTGVDIDGRDPGGITFSSRRSRPVVVLSRRTSPRCSRRSRAAPPSRSDETLQTPVSLWVNRSAREYRPTTFSGCRVYRADARQIGRYEPIRLLRSRT